MMHLLSTDITKKRSTVVMSGIPVLLQSCLLALIFVQQGTLNQHCETSIVP